MSCQQLNAGKCSVVCLLCSTRAGRYVSFDQSCRIFACSPAYILVEQVNNTAAQSVGASVTTALPESVCQQMKNIALWVRCLQPTEITTRGQRESTDKLMCGYFCCRESITSRI